jgi:hypothetical protein
MSTARVSNNSLRSNELTGLQFIWLGGYGFGYSKFDSPSRGVHFEDSPESGA